MISPIVGQITLGIYAVLLAVGALIGYFFVPAYSSALLRDLRTTLSG